MTDGELRVVGVEVLNNALGPVAALRLLSLWRRDATDYVEASRKLCDGQSVDEIYERTASRWTS